MTSVVVTNHDAGGAEEEDDVQFDIRMDTSKYKVCAPPPHTHTHTHTHTQYGQIA